MKKNLFICPHCERDSIKINWAICKELIIIEQLSCTRGCTKSADGIAGERIKSLQLNEFHEGEIKNSEIIIDWFEYTVEIVGHSIENVAKNCEECFDNPRLQFSWKSVSVNEEIKDQFEDYLYIYCLNCKKKTWSVNIIMAGKIPY